ncbi:hypothetical protein MCERE1_02273 [Burkholderiaceae bacterium]
MLIHQFDEMLVVCRLQQMHQFMHNDVIQAFPLLFGKVVATFKRLGDFGGDGYPV